VEQTSGLEKQWSIRRAGMAVFRSNFGGSTEIVMEFAKITAQTAGRAAGDRAYRLPDLKAR
jgi:hypothetical protein